MSFLASYMDHIMLVLGPLAALYAASYYFNMLQLESYQAGMYLKWLRKHFFRDWLPTILVFIICILLEISLPIIVRSYLVSGNEYILGLAALRLLYLCLMVYIGHTWRKQPAKKKLVYTGRVKRMMVAFLIIVFLGYLIPISVKVYSFQNTANVWAYSFTYMPALLLPLIVLLAHFITYPIEEGIKRYYLNEAKSKLKSRDDLIKIGITGSYGKTSTKFALGTILSEKYNTLVTPHSYNTPMGVTRVVREMLLPSHEVFVAEMGARYVGDIDELCELVEPQIGLLTSVGKQHLETFSSLENIASTKFELIASLPEDGAAFLNGDSDICRSLCTRSVNVKEKFLYGLKVDEGYAMFAGDIGVGPEGSAFTLFASDGESIECKTRLLGAHNIQNIVGAAAVAKYLGLSMRQIAAGIRKIEPVEHRLQLIQGQGGVSVIDDGFNSNPDGAKAALEVLRLFPGRHIVVTPGMVELGGEEALQNEIFGKEMAKAADIAILIGKKRSEPILKGLLSAGFPKENAHVVASLDEATVLLGQTTQMGDVVLIENDLPDNYNE